MQQDEPFSDTAFVSRSPSNVRHACNHSEQMHLDPLPFSNDSLSTPMLVTVRAVIRDPLRYVRKSLGLREFLKEGANIFGAKRQIVWGLSPNHARPKVKASPSV